MDRIAQIRRFAALGWKIASETEAGLQELQKLYAAFHGLSSVDDVVSHLSLPRYCNHPDVMPVTQSVAKWPDGNITFDVVAPLSQFGLAKMVDLVTQAFARWSAVAGIKATYTPGNAQARILIGTRAIDGPFGILAESELPGPGIAQTHQWYDTAEAWEAFNGPPAAGDQSIDVVRVMTHELGHALGMSHIGAGNLLAPIYDNNVWTPQAGDVKEMQSRYGPAIADPPPTGGGGDYVIRLAGGVLSVDGYRLSKLMGM